MEPLGCAALVQEVNHWKWALGGYSVTHLSPCLSSSCLVMKCGCSASCHAFPAIIDSQQPGSLN